MGGGSERWLVHDKAPVAKLLGSSAVESCITSQIPVLERRPLKHARQLSQLAPHPKAAGPSSRSLCRPEGSHRQQRRHAQQQRLDAGEVQLQLRNEAIAVDALAHQRGCRGRGGGQVGRLGDGMHVIEYRRLNTHKPSTVFRPSPATNPDAWLDPPLSVHHSPPSTISARELAKSRPGVWLPAPGRAAAQTAPAACRPQGSGADGR